MSSHVDAERPAIAEELLFPLNVLCRKAGIVPPLAQQVRGADIPLPHRDLLVHAASMTHRLEQYSGGELSTQVLSAYLDNGRYWRRVLLVEHSSLEPVELGAVCLRLDVFSPGVRRAILEGVLPIGRILRDGQQTFESRPSMFFTVSPNTEMMHLFDVGPRTTLYGRRTSLICSGLTVGDVVEVLPPIVPMYRDNQPRYLVPAREAI